MKIFLMLGLAGIITSCNSGTSNNATDTADTSNDTTAISPASSEDTGSIVLFDGTSLNSWHTFGQTTVGSAWNADSGTIHLNSAEKEGRGDLVSNDSFQNFDLKLEWKISRAGNSGILFYVQDDKPKYEDTYKTGPENAGT